MKDVRRFRFVLLFVVGAVMFFGMPYGANAALTKSGAEVDAWAAVLEDAIRIGATTDISDCYSAVLYIDVALTAVDLHEGTQLIVQTSGATAGTENWVDFTKLLCLADRSATAADGEATVGIITDANTVIDVADTDAGKWETEGTRWFFVLDGTVANSEMLQIQAYTNDASFNLVDNPVRTHASGVVLWDTAEKYQITLPIGAQRVRVIYDNTWDGDGTGAQMHCRSYITQVTGL
jgi:hypothetical protein